MNTMNFKLNQFYTSYSDEKKKETYFVVNGACVKTLDLRSAARCPHTQWPLANLRAAEDNSEEFPIFRRNQIIIIINLLFINLANEIPANRFVYR